MDRQERLQARVREKLVAVSRMSPQEKARLMAEGVKFSLQRNLIKGPEASRMRQDREFAAKMGRLGLLHMLSWEAAQEMKAEEAKNEPPEMPEEMANAPIIWQRNKAD